MKNPWIIIGVIVLVLIGGSVWYSNSLNETNNEGLSFSEHVKGNENGPVTLVEYSDFQCPACGAFHPVVAEIMADHGDSIRFEYKHFPLPIHPFAASAARAAEAAGQQGAFFEYHDLLFINQKEWSSGNNPVAFFNAYAEELDLDMATFKRHYNASLIKDRVDEASDEALELGLTSTPTFFLNGEKMSFTTYEEFYAQIEAAVATATSAPKQTPN